jgi:hypothetical protein
MADADIMALMQGGGAPDLAGETGVPMTASQPPLSAPMATPEPKDGKKEAALVNVSMALDLLEQTLPALGSETEEGKKVMSALSSLTALVGKKKARTDELQQAEIMQLLQNLPQAGGGTPASKMMQGAPPNLGLMNAPPPAPAGGMPGGMPMGGAQPPMPAGAPPAGPTPPMGA